MAGRFERSAYAPLDCSYNWVKMKRCDCNPPKFAEVRFSDSVRNPRKPYYKCHNGGCAFFDWVYADDVSNYDLTLNEDLAELKRDVADLTTVVSKISKLLWVLLVVVLVIVVRAW